GCALGCCDARGSGFLPVEDQDVAVGNFGDGCVTGLVAVHDGAPCWFRETFMPRPTRYLALYPVAWTNCHAWQQAPMQRTATTAHRPAMPDWQKEATILRWPLESSWRKNKGGSPRAFL